MWQVPKGKCFSVTKRKWHVSGSSANWCFKITVKTVCWHPPRAETGCESGLIYYTQGKPLAGRSLGLLLRQLSQQKGGVISMSLNIIIAHNMPLYVLKKRDMCDKNFRALIFCFFPTTQKSIILTLIVANRNEQSKPSGTTAQSHFQLLYKQVQE